MENVGDWEIKNNLVNELTRGKDLARQLQMLLNNRVSPPSSSSMSQETCEYLVQNILISFEKGISMLSWPNTAAAAPMSESPPSLAGSPRSDQDSDRDQEIRDSSKKRKSFPRWTKQVRVTPGVGLEGPLDDGFSWRKYGQKDILGAKYPRGYYRCTHRNVQGCLATKQVQRSDDDPTIFEITYRGSHTCTQASNTIPQPQDHNQEPIITNTNTLSLTTHQNMTNMMIDVQLGQQITQLDHDMLSNFKSGLKVVTEGLDESLDRSAVLPEFHFASSSHQAKNEVLNIENSFNVGGGLISPTSFHVSPAASATSYFSVSPQGGIEDHFRVVKPNFQNSETNNSSLNATNSAPETPNVGNNLEFPFGHVDDQFGSEFMFGHPKYF